MKKNGEQLYWVTPGADILAEPPKSKGDYSKEPSRNEIVSLLFECGIRSDCIKATAGASFVEYEMKLDSLKDYKKIKSAADAISARLRRSVTSGKSANADFSLCVTRAERQTVYFRDTLCSTPFIQDKRTTSCVLGNSTQRTLTADIATMPHLLIGGTTGSGKSVLLHSIVGSNLFKCSPANVQYLLIDPKQVEFTMYGNLPHLIEPVVTDTQKAVDILAEVCRFMDNRYAKMKMGVTDFPKLIVVIDELADLMLVSNGEVEKSIVRIAQLGRAAGIHLIVATQSPRATVITGLIKANITSRIALTVADWRESGIIGVPNAENLAGLGDALYQSNNHAIPPQRFQALFITNDDTQAIVRYWTSDKALTTMAEWNSR